MCLSIYNYYSIYWHLVLLYKNLRTCIYMIYTTFSIFMIWIFSIFMFWILLPIIKSRRNCIINRCITFTPATSFFGYVTLLYYVNAPNIIISIHFNKKFGMMFIIKLCEDYIYFHYPQWIFLFPVSRRVDAVSRPITGNGVSP